MTLTAPTHLPAKPVASLTDVELTAARRQIDAELASRTPKPAGHWYAADIDWSGDNPGQMMSWTPTKCECDAPWSHQRTL